MHDYEVTFILNPNLGEDEVTANTERVKALCAARLLHCVPEQLLPARCRVSAVEGGHHATLSTRAGRRV